MLKLDYDEISPITGKKTVLCEYDHNTQDTVKLCMTTGYQTYLNTWKQGNDLLAEYELQLPVDVLNSKVIDDNGNVWYKTVLQSPNVILYPDGNKWKVVPLQETISNEHTEVIPIEVPVNSEERGMRFLALDKSMEFESDEFEQALYNFQNFIAEKQGEI